MKTGDIFDGKYELLELLGSGGIGTVYKALQLDCGRLVALKVLHEHTAADEEYRSRFVREAQALNKLSHANIVTVYHLGMSSGMQPYMAMEYLEGESVRSVLARTRRFPVLQALRIIADAARACDYTHNQGIVHRDLKPENMILLKVPAPNTVKLVDFGLARLTDGQSPEQKLTRTGELIGSSAYMSPEQCMAKPVDYRTDIYSLSACLYEMMVGQKAVDADSALGLMYKQINACVPEIKAEQADRFHPVLNEIMLRGMAKAPEDRYADMAEMAEALDHAAVVLQTAKHTGLSRLATGVLSAVALAALLVLGGRFCENMHPKHADDNDIAVTAQEKTSAKIRRMQKQLVEWRDPAAIKSLALQERYADELFVLGRTQLKSSINSDIAAAEKTYSSAFEFCKQSDGRLKARAVAALALRGKAKWMQGKYADSNSDFQEALELEAKTVPDQAVRRDILAERVLLMIHMRRYEQALADFSAATADFVDMGNPQGNFSTKLMSLANEQALDRGGDNRAVMCNHAAIELLKMKPQSSQEAVQMILLANFLADKLLWVSQGEYARPVAEFSATLLDGVKNNDELKEQTRLVLERANIRHYRLGAATKKGE
jgi:hypothetical protein